MKGGQYYGKTKPERFYALGGPESGAQLRTKAAKLRGGIPG